MLFQKTVKTAGGSPLEFSIDEKADRLVFNDGSRELLVNFDLLLENKFKLTFAEAIAKPNFRTPGWLLADVGIISKNWGDEIFTFDSDDVELAQAIQKIGIPEELSFWMAFYSRPSKNESALDFRLKALEHFQAERHTARQENLGALAGFTTLELYMQLAYYSNLVTADHIARQALFYPEKMAELIPTIGRYLLSGVNLQAVSREQLASLMAITSPSFPSPREGEIRLQLLNEFVLEKTDWAKAAKLLREPNSLKSELGPHMICLVNGYPRSQVSMPRPSEESNVLVTLLAARYGEESIREALSKFLSLLPYFHSDSPYLFPAFVTLVEYIDSGYSPYDPIDWILSTNPSINQDALFKRGFGEEDD